jgi:hypothetical protein
MSGTGVWIGIALIVGFYLGVTLMSVLSIARDNERANWSRFSSIRIGDPVRRGWGGPLPSRDAGDSADNLWRQ